MFCFSLQDRKDIFKLKLATTKNCLTEGQIAKLAYKTTGRTGADIDAIVGKAMLMPLTKLRRSLRFVEVPIPLLCLDRTCTKKHLVEGRLEKGQDMVYIDAQHDEYCVPAVTYDDVLGVLTKFPITVPKEHLKKHVEYAKSIDLEINEPLVD